MYIHKYFKRYNGVFTNDFNGAKTIFYIVVCTDCTGQAKNGLREFSEEARERGGREEGEWEGSCREKKCTTSQQDQYDLGQIQCSTIQTRLPLPSALLPILRHDTCMSKPHTPPSSYLPLPAAVDFPRQMGVIQSKQKVLLSAQAERKPPGNDADYFKTR
eukprot:765875-Hanusia_phi.AAC.3